MVGAKTVTSVFRILVLTVVGYVFFIFHGLSSHLDPWSQALINAVVKYGYPTTGQQDITVLLFREENLADLKTQYPVPYSLHTDIIEALADYEPRAVFIDFAFVDNRDEASLKQLSDSLCRLTKAGSNVYLATPLDENKRPIVAPGLLDCAHPAMPEMDGKTAESGTLTYFHGQKTPERFIASPAFALAGAQNRVKPENGEKLEIIWGKGVAPLNLKWMRCHETRGIELLKSVLFENPLSDRLDCPYHRTISVNHLLNSVGDADIETALRGKTVFYGAGFRFTGDRVESPVYGELPGVYLHAMAYDNLLTFGENYKRADRHGWLTKSIDFLLLLAAAILLVWFPAQETSEAESLIGLIEHTRQAVIATLSAATILAAALQWGGLDLACLAGALIYLTYRIAIQRDRAFALLAALTIATTIFCYAVLNLGPRNILAFIAFFEIVGHYHEKLIKKAKTYHELRQHFRIAQLSEQEGASEDLPAWDKILNKFFRIFYQPSSHPQEPKP